MKKAILTILACAAVLTSCQKEVVLVSAINLNQTTASVVEEGTVQLSATVLPDNAENKTLEWSSDNAAVATVNPQGLVTAVKAGTAKITAAATDGSGVKSTCTVEVTAKAIPVTKIDLQYTSYKLKVGETLSNPATVKPDDATNKVVAYSSDKTDVASVDDKGLITAKAAGTAKIKATATDGSGVVSAECEVTVIAPKTMFLKFENATIKVGGKTVTQSVWYGSVDKFAEREDVDNPTWTSGDTAVATVDKGKVTAVAPGSTTVTVTDADGNSASFPVKVLAATVVDYDYNYGVQVLPCDNFTSPEWKTKGTFSLTEGYVSGTQRITVAELTGYKLFEVNFYDKPCDASKIQNPALYLRIYIDDVTKIALSGGGEIELRSNCESTYAETEEITWPWNYWCADATNAHPTNAKHHLKNGWNNIVLPFALSHQGQTTSDLGGFRKNKISYLRIFQEPGIAKVGACIKIDQVRIVDATEFDNCDNFDMWYDRMTDNNACLCSLDTEVKTEGKGSFSVNGHLLNGPVSALRLEFKAPNWAGREYCLPADQDASNSTLQFQFWVDDADAFNQQIIVAELSSELVNDQHNFAWTLAANSLNLKNGWNTISLPFAACGGDTRPESLRDLRKINYFRLVLNPVAPYARHTYKIDDIRIIKK